MQNAEQQETEDAGRDDFLGQMAREPGRIMRVLGFEPRQFVEHRLIAFQQKESSAERERQVRVARPMRVPKAAEVPPQPAQVDFPAAVDAVEVASQAAIGTDQPVAEDQFARSAQIGKLDAVTSHRVCAGPR